jgi:hypothetical protein
MGGTGGGPDPYTTAVLADAPVAWWRLDDQITPLAIDSGPNGYDGTYLNGVLLDQPGILPSSASVLFDGVNGQVATGDVLDFAGDASFSVEAWINSDDQDGFIAGKLTHDGSAFHGWMLAYLAPTGFRFRRHGSTIAVGGVATAGTWAHVVGTFDGVSARLYVDGAEVDAQPQSPTLVDHDGPFTIAMGQNWGRLEGRIDEVAVYDHALTPARVQAHRQAGLGR